MGMEHVVRFPDGRLPDLTRIMTTLAEHRFPVQLRMVDGELTLPDETIPDGWRDVRLGTPAGMVTLARRGEALAVVIWGNADTSMQGAWNAVAWAAAAAGRGEIVGAGGVRGPEEFRSSAIMPEGFTP